MATVRWSIREHDGEASSERVDELLVDERLKEDQESRRLELEELKAAARRALDRLKAMGFTDGALSELSERDPEIDDAVLSVAADFYPERRECPVCGYGGWLGYDVISRGDAYAELDPRHHDEYHFVDVTIEADRFVCGVCGLHLGSELLHLEAMTDFREIAVEATKEEIDALEHYEFENYLERQLERD